MSVQIGTFNLPETPSVGDEVSILADSSTTIPSSGITWDLGGEPVVTGRLWIACVWSGDDWVCTYGLPIPNADQTDPTPGTLAASSITATAFTLTVSGASDDVALDATPYAFSLDNGTTWSAWQSGATLNATGLAPQTEYTCLHRVRDSSGGVAIGSSIVVETGLLITDDFNRANSSTTLGNTTTGQTWAPDSGSTWGINSNTAYKVSPDSTHTCATADLGSADMTVTGTIAASSVNPGYPGIAARVTNANTAYIVWFSNSDNLVYLVRRIAGSQTLLDNVAGAVGNTVTLSTVEEGGGTRVIAKVNGTEFANILDDTSGRPSATKAGIFAYRTGTNHRVDNFSAETVQ